MNTNENEFPGVEWNPISKIFIEINTNLCNGCGYCVNVCLAKCFELRDKKVMIRSLKYCMECSSCWYICPQDAIIFNYPPGGEGFKTRFG